VAESKRRDEFAEFLTRLVRVPKEEIDEQKIEHKKTQKREGSAKPGKVVRTNNLRPQ
jgi:hypothetical protein